MFTAFELGKEILASRVWGLRVQALKGLEGSEEWICFPITALLQRLCDPKASPALGISVSAPVKWGTIAAPALPAMRRTGRGDRCEAQSACSEAPYGFKREQALWLPF